VVWRPDEKGVPGYRRSSFDRHGGGFIVEIAQCAAEGVTTHWGKQIAANKVTGWDLPPAH
jgi:hypothetical protein